MTARAFSPILDRMGRQLNLIAGLVSIGLGIIGFFLPVMPSTCFFILSVYFFSQSSPRMENWVLSHPKWGPPVLAWRKHRAISLKGKLAAFCGMTLGFILLVLSAAPVFVKLGGGIFIFFSAWYVGSRPTLNAVAVKSRL